MPCVYLPGPAPAVTVANKHNVTRVLARHLLHRSLQHQHYVARVPAHHRLPAAYSINIMWHGFRHTTACLQLTASTSCGTASGTPPPAHSLQHQHYVARLPTHHHLPTAYSINIMLHGFWYTTTCPQLTASTSCGTGSGLAPPAHRLQHQHYVARVPAHQHLLTAYSINIMWHGFRHITTCPQLPASTLCGTASGTPPPAHNLQHQHHLARVPAQHHLPTAYSINIMWHGFRDTTTCATACSVWHGSRISSSILLTSNASNRLCSERHIV
jgi:hypothetical protein